MSELLRVMTPDRGDGKPLVGRSPRQLGVRVPPDGTPDIRPDAEGRVGPGRGGMSVSPEPIANLPRHRVPRGFGCGATGHAADAIYGLDHQAVPTTLQVRPDPGRPAKHAFVEPAELQPLGAYEAALASTRSDWRAIWP